MSNSTQYNVAKNQENDSEITFLKENNSTNTTTTAEPQEHIDHLESCPILTTETNLETTNNTAGIIATSTAAKNNVNTKIDSTSEDKEGILANAKDIARDVFTLFGFILYLSDILSDISVSIYYFFNEKYGYGCLILFLVYYGAALAAHNYVRDADTSSRRNSRLCMIFILNLSGVLLYREITYMLYRKWSKKDYCKTTLKARQDTLRTVMYYEGMCEGYPQILIQTCIMSESIIANEHISWLRYTSVVLSTLGFIFAIIRFGLNKSDTPTNRTTYDKVTDFLWATFGAGVLALVLFTVTAATASSGNIYFIIIPFIIFALINYIFTGILYIYDMDNSDFVSKIVDPLSPRTKILLQRLAQFSGIIMTTICWYYTRNAILWYWPLTFDYINYLSIVYCGVGLVAIMFKVVQLIIIFVKGL